MRPLAPYRSVTAEPLEIWDQYEKDRKAWLRKVRRAEKKLAEQQGCPGERALAWTFGKANDDRHRLIGFSHLRLPREEGEPSWRLTKHCPTPPGWRHLVDDDYLTPIPENGRKGGDPKSPEAVAARELMASVQPPKTIASRFAEAFEMPVMVWGTQNDNRVYWPGLEEVKAEGERIILVCWGTDSKVVDWNGGDAFVPLKPSEYYALKGE